MRNDRLGALILVFLSVAAGCAAPEPAPEYPVLPNGLFTADLNGVAIRYAVHGEGPVVMTLPNSWGLSHQGLRALYKPLEEHVTMVYFDPRGMGESGAIREDADMGTAAIREDFDALRRHLGLDKVHALGWSNGAMNLLLYAAEKPETLESAIFLHGVATFSEADMASFAQNNPELIEKFVAYEQQMADESLQASAREHETKRFTLETWFPALFADPDKGLALARSLFVNTDFSWEHSQYSRQEWPTFDARDKLASIEVPCLVLAGAHDLMPPSGAEQIHQGVKDSTFVVFDDSAHFAPLEEPERFAEVVLGFLGLEGAAPTAGHDHPHDE